MRAHVCACMHTEARGSCWAHLRSSCAPDDCGRGRPPGGRGRRGALRNAAARAGILTGSSTCQAASEEEDDDDDFAEMQDAEEALVEATADAVVTLAASLGGPAFMNAWKVRDLPPPHVHVVRLAS